jgi:hypothetical protein
MNSASSHAYADRVGGPKNYPIALKPNGNYMSHLL